MSKAKKIISAILAVIVLVGIGFGAYILFFKKDKEFKLTEERAIKLIGEANAKQSSAINIVGKTFASDTSSQSISGGQGLFAQNINENGRLSETDKNQISRAEEYLKYYCDLLENFTYAKFGANTLQLDKDKTIKFGKTYKFTIMDNTWYGVYDYNDDIVMYEIKNDVIDICVVLEYDKEKDVPKSYTLFAEQDWNENDPDFGNNDGVYSFFDIAYTNFETNQFNYYYIRSEFENCDNFDKAHDLRNKLANGTLKYADLSDYLKYNRSSYYDEEVLYAYAGNVANNINDLKFKSIRNTDVETLFNTYSTSVKNLDMVALSKSKIDTKNAIEDTGLFEKAFRMSSASVFDAYIKDGKFYFYRVTDQKQFDLDVLTSLKTKLATMTYENADNSWHDGIRVNVNGGENSFNKIKTAIDLLNNSYETHKNDEVYISMLLGYPLEFEDEGIYCAEMTLLSDKDANMFYYAMTICSANPETSSTYEYYGSIEFVLAQN